MTKIPVNTKLNAIHQGKDSHLYPMISAKTLRKEKTATSGGSNTLLWQASWWGFDRSQFFNQLEPTQQHHLLAACNRLLINEAYFIEKSGLAYTAKMTLLAESTDIAQLYSLISADEARHLAYIEPFILEADKTKPYGAFLEFLSSLIETYPPYMLVYLVQIILEGWGLDHYRRLMQGCQDPTLKQRLQHIVKDEALHHQSGISLYNPTLFSKKDREALYFCLNRYTEMVRIGPQSALYAVKQVVGTLSLEEKEDLLNALQHHTETTRKLLLLKELMTQNGVEDVVEKLEKEGKFTPLSTHEAALLCAI